MMPFHCHPPTIRLSTGLVVLANALFGPNGNSYSQFILNVWRMSYGEGPSPNAKSRSVMGCDASPRSTSKASIFSSSVGR